MESQPTYPTLSADRHENTETHEELHNEQQGHETQRSLLAKRVIVDLGHWLTVRRA